VPLQHLRMSALAGHYQTFVDFDKEVATAAWTKGHALIAASGSVEKDSVLICEPPWADI
jgi:hypothetical protein